MKIFSYMAYELNPLPYDYDSLEPYIDKETMEIHHNKHHQTYVNKLNDAIKKHPELEEKSVKELLENIDSVPKDIKQAVINHGGGAYNHNFFFSILKKDVRAKGKVIDEIKKTFGSYDEFKKQFSEAAITLFGSGWAWIVLDKNKLKIVKTKNQDSPISSRLIPILGIDVWEHAYYLKYQNKRPDYIEAFFHVINWEQVEKNYQEAKNK